MRFSLRWLLGFVAFVAIACPSLIYATTTIVHLLSAAFFAFLMVSTLGAIYAGCQRRRFFVGCVLVGLSYAATAYVPSGLPMPWGATNAAVDYLHPKVVHKVAGELEPSIFPRTKPSPFYIELPLAKDFRNAAQIIAAFVWSFSGGIVAGRFRRDG